MEAFYGLCYMISLTQADDSFGGSTKNHRLEAVDKSGGDFSKSGVSVVNASEAGGCTQRPGDIRGDRTAHCVQLAQGSEASRRSRGHV